MRVPEKRTYLSCLLFLKKVQIIINSLETCVNLVTTFIQSIIYHSLTTVDNEGTCHWPAVDLVIFVALHNSSFFVYRRRNTSLFVCFHILEFKKKIIIVSNFHWRYSMYLFVTGRLRPRYTHLYTRWHRRDHRRS